MLHLIVDVRDATWIRPMEICCRKVHFRFSADRHLTRKQHGQNLWWCKQIAQPACINVANAQWKRLNKESRVERTADWFSVSRWEFKRCTVVSLHYQVIGKKMRQLKSNFPNQHSEYEKNVTRKRKHWTRPLRLRQAGLKMQESFPVVLPRWRA